MERLEFHLTVHGDNTVHARLSMGATETYEEKACLDLSDLETVTQDYLPLLEERPKHTRDRLERFGTRLYRMLFVGEVRALFEQLALRRVVQYPDRCRLALLLTLDEGFRPDVAALPWEFLFCPRGRTFLATDPRVAFSRRYSDWAFSPARPLGGEGLLRVQLVRLQPKDASTVAWARIRATVEDLAKKNSVRISVLNPLENPAPAELESAIRERRPEILHLLAHGRFDPKGTFFAAVEGAENQSRPYGDRSLADLVDGFRPRLVVLQACESGRLSDVESFAHGAAWLLRKQVPAVIAMRFSITNEVGWTFAETFYRELVSGKELAVAAQHARRQLALHDQKSSDDHATRDFAAPVVWMRPTPSELEKESLMISVTISTPDGARFEADAPADEPVGELLREFLSQWQPPPGIAAGPARYEFCLDAPDAPPVDRSSALRNVGPTGRTRLSLRSSPLTPESPVGLTIEDDHGRRFVTAVLLRTKVGELADQFFRDRPGPGVPAVELVGGVPGTERPRRLSLTASLYDEGVGDDALLHLYRSAEAAEVSS